MCVIAFVRIKPLVLCFDTALSHFNTSIRLYSTDIQHLFHISVYILSLHHWKVLVVQTASLSVISLFYFIHTISFLHSFSHVLLALCFNELKPNWSKWYLQWFWASSIQSFYACTAYTLRVFIFRKCIRIIYWLIITRHVFRVHWRKTNWRWCC